MTTVLSLAAARAARGLPPAAPGRTPQPAEPEHFAFPPPAGPFGSPAGDDPDPEPPEAA